MRERLTNESSSSDEKKLALSILSGDASPENMTVFLSLLDAKEFATIIIPLLRRYDRPEVGQQLVVRLANWSDTETGAAMEFFRPEPAGLTGCSMESNRRWFLKNCSRLTTRVRMAALGNSS